MVTYNYTPPTTKRFKKAVYLVILVILLFVSGIVYACYSMFKSAGMLVSSETGNASSLYELYPFEQDGKHYFISVEGVFKTNSYEQSGGMVNRSGTTSFRLGLFNLANGEKLQRLVTSDSYDQKIEVLGKAGNRLWFYSTANGLHSRSLPGLAIDITTEKIMAANKELAAGFAKADKYFNNLDELFTADETANAIMVTSINGKSTWLNAATFATIPAPVVGLQKNNFLSLLQKMVQEAKTGGKIDTVQIANRLRVLASDLDYSFFNSHTANFVTCADGCFYRFEGSTLSSLVRSNCPGNNKPNNDTLYKTPSDKQFIEASFLTNDINITGNPEVLPASGTPYATQAREEALYIINKDKIAPDAHLMLGKYDIEKRTTSWQYDLSANLTTVPTIESTYVLNNLIIIVLKTHPKLDDSFSCVAIDKTTGKAAWQFTF